MQAVIGLGSEVHVNSHAILNLRLVQEGIKPIPEVHPGALAMPPSLVTNHPYNQRPHAPSPLTLHYTITTTKRNIKDSNTHLPTITIRQVQRIQTFLFHPFTCPFRPPPFCTKYRELRHLNLNWKVKYIDGHFSENSVLRKERGNTNDMFRPILPHYSRFSSKRVSEEHQKRE